MGDLYLTATQRTAVDRLMQGCDDQADPGNLTLIRSGSSSDSTSGPNAAVSLAFGRNPSKYCSPLNFENVTGRGLFDPSNFGDHLEYEILFSDRTQVIISTDTGATVNYSLNNIELEFEIVSSARLAADIALSSQGRFALAYKKNIRHRRMQLNGGQTS